MKITQASTADIPKLISLIYASEFFQQSQLAGRKIDRAGLEKSTLKAVERDMQDDTSAYFMALDEAKIVGYVLAEFSRMELGRGWINDIYVEPNSRAQGIATELLERAEAWLKSNEVTRVHLGVHLRNENAARLYGALGYKTVEPEFAHMSKSL